MFVVDLERAVAVLDGLKSEGRLYWAVSGPVCLDGRDATQRSRSQMASGLAESRSFSMRAGSRLFVALSSAAGSLTLVLRMPVS
jgi:hypothetical protein